MNTYMATVVLSYSIEVEASNPTEAEGMIIDDATREYRDCVIEAVRIVLPDGIADAEPIEVEVQ